eukprot:TRINITY_DN69_c1_g1_i1.p1 TRINITY_DN69_c1_g1~~TRINITY_DN69_c1_g1_i1.p1  ORF type:complete len:356 (+),score=80.64 TRINITY_DN69_c1_g1_i1:97-1164(+)
MKTSLSGRASSFAFQHLRTLVPSSTESSMDEFRKQLDALMGSNRNGDQGQRKHFTDPDICKWYLAGTCPHELFTNTKADLGDCKKQHAEIMKAEYDEARKTKDYGFELDLEREYERIISDCDRKIARNQQRLDDMEPTPTGPVGPAVDPAMQLADARLTEEIKNLLQQAEKLGEEGKVDESLELMNRADALKERKEAQALAPPPLPESSIASQQQKLRVCEICSAYLSLYDSDRRLADHFGGKLHVGYLTIREKLKEMKERRKARQTNDDRFADRERDREKTRYGREREDRDRDRERDRDRYSAKRSDSRDNRDDRDRGGYRGDYDRGSRDYDRGGRRDRDYDRHSSGERRRPYD